MMKRYFYALSFAVIGLCSNSLKAQESSPEYRWELNLGMINPFVDAESTTITDAGAIEESSYLPVAKNLGIGLKYAFGSYAWRFSVSGNTAYYSFDNPDIDNFRSYSSEIEESNIEFRMGVEKRIQFDKAQFYFGSDLVMARVRRFRETSYEFLTIDEERNFWNSKRTKISGISFHVGMKYFFHERFSILAETRADALGYEILKNSEEGEELKDTSGEFVLRPFGTLSLNFHF